MEPQAAVSMPHRWCLTYPKDLGLISVFLSIFCRQCCYLTTSKWLYNGGLFHNEFINLYSDTRKNYDPSEWVMVAFQQINYLGSLHFLERDQLTYSFCTHSFLTHVHPDAPLRGPPHSFTLPALLHEHPHSFIPLSQLAWITPLKVSLARKDLPLRLKGGWKLDEDKAN